MTREPPSTDVLSSRETGAPEEPELIDYDLPPELIAQEPAETRHGSRLLVLDRALDRLEHRAFREISSSFRPGDILVVNDTRVIPARLRARRETGGAVEVLLLEEEADQEGAWEVLLRPGRAGRPGSVMRIDGSSITARAVGRRDEAFLVEFLEKGRRLGKDEVLSLAERAGETPLPPYIERRPEDARSSRDRERYQTVWAEKPGAVAAPTAGLHFSPEVLGELERAGVERLSITLHVGIDTFRPLSPETLRTGRLHGERVEVSREVGERILEARKAGRRVIAVGTTTVRALESFAASDGRLPYRERTDLFIRRGHRFRLTDALITNFHLPRTSLLLLVAAFAGRERILRAYREAVKERYRFYSYGDAMLIV